MTIRVAAIEVAIGMRSHDAAYLRHLIAMPDVELVAIQDSDADLSRDARPRWGGANLHATTESASDDPSKLHSGAWTALPNGPRSPTTLLDEGYPS